MSVLDVDEKMTDAEFRAEIKSLKDQCEIMIWHRNAAESKAIALQKQLNMVVLAWKSWSDQLGGQMDSFIKDYVTDYAGPEDVVSTISMWRDFLSTADMEIHGAKSNIVI